MPVQAADPNADPAANAIAEREISWKKLLPSFLDDQKKIWLFPTKVARGEHVFPTLAVLGVTAGLVAADPIEAVAVAQRQAVAAQSVEYDDPTDFHPLLVTQGHHYSEPLFNK